MSPRTFFEYSLEDLEQAARSINEAIKVAKEPGAQPHHLTAPVQVALCRLDNIARNLPRVVS